MITICKNCEHTFQGNFCNNCGQSADTHTINAHFLWHDIQHGLFHIETKLLLTIKELFLSPGLLIKNYLKGKRVDTYNPISMLLILAAFYGFLCHFFHVHVIDFASKSTADNDNFFNLKDIDDWYIMHYSWISLLLLPFYSLASKLSFRKQHFFFLEHVIINTFLLCQILVVQILFVPIIFLSKQGSALQNILYNVLFSISFLFIMITYFQVFDQLKPVKRLLLSLLSYFIYAFLVSITVLIIVLILMNFHQTYVN